MVATFAQNLALIRCFWENAFYGRTDGRPHRGIGSADTVKQS